MFLNSGSNPVYAKQPPPKGDKQHNQDLVTAYLQELGELEVAEVFLIVVPKVQTDELTVPVKGNVVVHRSLAENVPHILCRKKST